MKLKEQNILFFTRNMELGGTENVILQMCEVLKPRVNKIIVCSHGGVNIEKLKQMGIKHYYIPDISNVSFRTVFNTFRIINKIIKDEHITVVHTHHRMAAFYTCIISRFTKIHFLASVHGEFFDKRVLTNIAYSRALIIVCGENVKSNITNFFGIKKNIIVLRNAVIQDRSPLIQISDIERYREEGYRLVGYVGRLSKEKGILYLINSLTYYSQDERIVYVIVGDGAMKGEMLSQLDKVHCRDRVIYLGYRDDPQNVIRQLDCIVLPSLTEGLPLTPMEAFAQGKPVIASEVGGNIELVRDGENGILIRPKNAFEITEAVRKLLFNKEFYEYCSKNAKRDYDLKYDISVFNEQLVNIYKNI